jgi:hypothetical protein
MTLYAYTTDRERGKILTDCIQTKYNEAEQERKESAQMLREEERGGTEREFKITFHQKQRQVAMIYSNKIEIEKSLRILDAVRKTLTKDDTRYIESIVWENVVSKLYAQSTNGEEKTHTFIGKDRTYTLSRRAMLIIQNTPTKRTCVSTQTSTSCSNTDGWSISSRSDTSQGQDMNTEETVDRDAVIQEAAESGALLSTLANIATQIINQDVVIKEAAETGELLSALAGLVAQTIGLPCTPSQECTFRRCTSRRSTSKRDASKRVSSQRVSSQRDTSKHVPSQRDTSQRDLLHIRSAYTEPIVTRSIAAQIHATDVETDITKLKKRKYNISSLYVSGVETTEKIGVCKHTRSQAQI